MYEFKVQGMTCGHCVNTITSAVRNLDSKAKVTAEIKTQTVKIESSQDAKEVVARIEDAGYPVVSTVSTK